MTEIRKRARRLLGCVFILAVNTASAGEAKPRITADDYARAERWMQPTAYVRNLLPIPHWVGDSDEFWYRRETVSGYEFTLVDASDGDKQPAFDHRAIAKALTEAGFADVTGKDLPFTSFEFVDRKGAIEFVIGGQSVRCSLKHMLCERVPPLATKRGLLLSPNRELAVYSEDGNLYLKELSSGKEIPLTTDGAPHNGYGIYYDNWKASFVARERSGVRQLPMETQWSPDSRLVLVSHLDDRHVKEYPLVETVPDDGTFRPKVYLPRIPLAGEKPPLLTWYLIDIESGATVKVDLPYNKLLHVHQDVTALRKTWWSDDCTRLYALAWGDSMQSAYLFEIDAETGASRVVLHESGSPRMDTNSTSYNPPNVEVIGDGREVIWFSMRDGWGHLYLYDGVTGQLKNQITRGDWLVRDIVEVDADNRLIFFTASGRESGNPYYRYLYQVGFDGSGFRLLSPEYADHLITSPYNDVVSLDGAIGSEVISPTGKYAVYSYSRPSTPTRSVIRKVSDTSKVAEFESADTEALYEAGWRDPEEFVVKAADGETDLYGLMYKPANFDPDRAYPVIDSQYASPLTAAVPRNFIQVLNSVPGKLSQMSLTELGFVVVVIDARGTAFRSREFSHYSWKNLDTIGLEDHVAAIRQLADRYPWIDIERVGIHGSSYGGFATFRAMFEFPEFYKVGISSAGPNSIHSMYPDYHWSAFHGKPVYPRTKTRYYADPTAKPVNYRNVDGTVRAARMKGKLLITLAELDEHVLPGTTLQLIAKLMELDKDLEMIYIPGANHFYRSGYVVHRMWDFFVEHLHGQQPPQFRMGQNGERGLPRGGASH